jgi:hypothetical protein
MSWCRAHFVDVWPDIAFFQMFRSGICCSVSVGRPLWRENGSVICQSPSDFTADSQSVFLGAEPTLWTIDQILLLFQEFGSWICCPVPVGRPLWREAGSVLCKSQSSHLSVCTFTVDGLTFSCRCSTLHVSAYMAIYNKAAHRRQHNLKTYWSKQCSRMLKYNIVYIYYLHFCLSHIYHIYTL